ncbi:ABC transporter permease [Candidatus Acetothermia bacterium]|nr:ABC transporter permease [Candidatus Acetothermia bacterium]
MTGISVLIKKELKEQLKTYKLFILAGIFLLFEIVSPLTFYFLPEFVPEEVVAMLPAFTVMDVVKEYVEMLSFMGMLAVILISMGAIATERDCGTAAMVLCKPVGRGSFIVAKLVGLSLTTLVGLALGGLACYFYTSFLFGGLEASAFLSLHLLLGLFFITCLAVILLCSSLVKNQLAAGGMALVAIIGGAIVSGIPAIGDYTPNRLVSWGTELVAGPAPSAWWVVAVSLGVIVVCLFLSWFVLQRKEL